jgi:hypothetical protein
MALLVVVFVHHIYVWSIQLSVVCALQAAAAGAAAGGGPKKRLEDAVGWIKGLGAAATNIVGGSSRATDTAEDPEYIKVGLWTEGHSRVQLAADGSLLSCMMLEVLLLQQDAYIYTSLVTGVEQHAIVAPRLH